MHAVRLLIRSLLVMFLMVSFSAAAFAQVSGAIFTTESACDGTNVNIFSSQQAAYLDGGPRKPGSAGLPDGSYYVMVTEPNGTVLGRTTSASVVVSGGEFAQCYQLWAILSKASTFFTVTGYDATTNSGGEYKVWASKNPAFPNNESKTDNFKVHSENGGGSNGGSVTACKYYDFNTDAAHEQGEPLLTGWPMTLTTDPLNDLGSTQLTGGDGCTTFEDLSPHTYSVVEGTPDQANWFASNGTQRQVVVELGQGEFVEFGNYCLVPSGGLTLGFWSNKNGQALIAANSSWLATLSGMNLVSENGNPFDPTSGSRLRNWLLNGTATNMSYMLSVQLATMKLNILNGNVDAGAFYPPYDGTIGELVAEANAFLAGNANTIAAGEARSQGEVLKNFLDALNNRANVVPVTPCSRTFTPPAPPSLTSDTEPTL